jgi:hypothetical protein
MESKVRWIVLAAVFLLILAIGYVISVKRTGRREPARPVYASIVMPDGSIVSGECSGYDRNDRYVTVYMTDKVYKVSDWRVAIWYDQKYEQSKQGSL